MQVTTNKSFQTSLERTTEWNIFRSGLASLNEVCEPRLSRANLTSKPHFQLMPFPTSVTPNLTPLSSFIHRCLLFSLLGSSRSAILHLQLRLHSFLQPQPLEPTVCLVAARVFTANFVRLRGFIPPLLSLVDSLDTSTRQSRCPAKPYPAKSGFKAIRLN